MIPERQAMNRNNPDELDLGADENVTGIEENELGALERLGIEVQTTPPAQILTTGKAKSIRFRVSRPHGYSYGDVESYQFDFVIPTLEWYAETLYQRDFAIHKLGELVDKIEVDLQNAKAQLDNKDFNAAIGFAVDENEGDAEMAALLLKVGDLQLQLEQSNAALAEAQNAGITSPDGDESYTREEVEGFLSSAVEDATTERDKYYAELLAHKDSEFAAMMEQVKEQAQLDAAASSPAGYSDEELHAAIEEAVNSTLTEEVKKAVAESEQKNELQYNSLVEKHAVALIEAETRATKAEQRAALAEQNALSAEERASAVEELAAAAENRASLAEERVASAEAKALSAENSREESEQRAASLEGASNGYSQEEMENAIAQAVAEKEAEILSQLPVEAQPIDQIAELTNEGDLKFRAENKTLKKTVKELDEYSKQLEKYITVLEGGSAEVQTPATASNGRALPTLRADDL